MKFQFIRKKPTPKQKVQILVRNDLQRINQLNCNQFVRALDPYEFECFPENNMPSGVLVYLDELNKTQKNKHGLKYLYLTKEQFDYAISDED